MLHSHPVFLLRDEKPEKNILKSNLTARTNYKQWIPNKRLPSSRITVVDNVAKTKGGVESRHSTSTTQPSHTSVFFFSSLKIFFLVIPTGRGELPEFSTANYSGGGGGTHPEALPFLRTVFCE